MEWILTDNQIAFELPDSDSHAITIATMVDGGRSANNGKFVGQVIGDDKMSISLSWRVLSPESVQRLFNLFDRRAPGGKFVRKIRVYDVRTLGFVWKWFYVSDRSTRPAFVDPVTGKPQMMLDTKFTLVEV